MKLVRVSAILLLSLILCSCSIAPFSHGNSAHTVDHKALSIQGGVSENGEVPYLRLAYGVSQNFELGVVSETQFGEVTTGLTAKYAFINNPEKGSSLSVESSLGGSGNSTYAYIGPIVGYKTKYWDGYAGARYNYVRVGYHDLDLDFGWWGRINLSEEKVDLQYGVVTVGNTIWLNKRIGLNLNVNYALGDAQGLYAGAGLTYVFNKK